MTVTGTVLMKRLETTDGVADTKYQNKIGIFSTVNTPKKESLSRHYRIDVYRNFDGEFYYFVRARGNKILTSSFYSSKDCCIKNALKIARVFKCKINFIDLRYDYEE